MNPDPNKAWNHLEKAARHYYEEAYRGVCRMPDQEEIDKEIINLKEAAVNYAYTTRAKIVKTESYFGCERKLGELKGYASFTVCGNLAKTEEADLKKIVDAVLGEGWICVSARINETVKS